MAEKELIQLFGEQKVRTKWDDEKQKWYFSIVDVCGMLTESKDPQSYWRKLKQRLKDEGNETVTNCHQLKMKAAYLLQTGYRSCPKKRKIKNGDYGKVQYSNAC